jgi:hypothetical protein
MLPNLKTIPVLGAMSARRAATTLAVAGSPAGWRDKGAANGIQHRHDGGDKAEPQDSVEERAPLDLRVKCGAPRGTTG